MAERNSWLSRPLRSRLSRLGAAQDRMDSSMLLRMRQRRLIRPEVSAEDIAANDIATLEAADLRPAPAPPVSTADHSGRLLDPGLLRLAGLGLALVLALTLTLVKLFVAGPPSIAELRAKAGVDGWTVLNIGVKDDQPGVAYFDGQAWSGFDIDIAYMVAEDLGFRRDQVHFNAVESEDRARMQATDTAGNRVAVQMVIASYSITKKRQDMGVTFSAPYLYTEQSVVTRKGHKPVTTLDDLLGHQICSLSTSTSADAVAKVQPPPVMRNKISECFQELLAGNVEAVTTDAAILAGYLVKYPGKFWHWDLGLDATEKWGINVGENPSLQTLVNVSLYKSYRDPHDERWDLAFRNNLENEILQNNDSLHKTPIAVAQQPPVDRPDVRQLPWENDLP